MKPTIAITMGDPAGIGPEIIVKALSLPTLYRRCHPIVLGDPNVFREAAQSLSSSIRVEEISDARNQKTSRSSLRVLKCTRISPEDFKLGIPTAHTGRAAYESIETAVRLAIRGDVSAITTAPISKEALVAAGYPFPGHTELLASMAKSQEVGMLMLAPFTKRGNNRSSWLRILLVTTHTALNSISKTLTTQKVLSAIRLAFLASQQIFSIEQPRVAVSGLNPHAGEGGLFGSEEETIILPAIRKAHGMGYRVDGPFPADTLMVRAVRGEYDMVIAMYHDQAMIPVKLLSFGKAVNITVGLPFIRTSVDHGTAYDIAGKGKADSGSLVSAITLAANLSKKHNRTQPVE